MSHKALKPESFATDSNLLKGSLRYMQGAALRPSLTLARHLGLLVHLTGVNQLQLIPPTSYGGVLRHLIPEPNRPSPTGAACGGVLGGRVSTFLFYTVIFLQIMRSFIRGGGG